MGPEVGGPPRVVAAEAGRQQGVKPGWESARSAYVLLVVQSQMTFARLKLAGATVKPSVVPPAALSILYHMRYIFHGVRINTLLSRPHLSARVFCGETEGSIPRHCGRQKAQDAQQVQGDWFEAGGRF